MTVGIWRSAATHIGDDVIIDWTPYDDEVAPFLGGAGSAGDGRSPQGGALIERWAVDGTPYDANAIIFNIKRQMDPANKFTFASNDADIDSMTAVDSQTVQFKLKAPKVATVPTP